MKVLSKPNVRRGKAVVTSDHVIIGFWSWKEAQRPIAGIILEQRYLGFRELRWLARWGWISVLPRWVLVSLELHGDLLFRHRGRTGSEEGGLGPGHCLKDFSCCLRDTFEVQCGKRLQ